MPYYADECPDKLCLSIFQTLLVHHGDKFYLYTIMLIYFIYTPCKYILIVNLVNVLIVYSINKFYRAVDVYISSLAGWSQPVAEHVLVIAEHVRRAKNPDDSVAQEVT